MRRPTKIALTLAGAAIAFGLVARRDRARTIGAAEDTCLVALLTFEDHVVGNDGVTRDGRWQERLVRCDDGVWQARVLPNGAPKPPSETHHLPEPYTMARWVKPVADDRASLALVSDDTKTIVDVEPAFFENVAFDGTWSTSFDLVPRATRDGLVIGEQKAPDGAHWLERRSDKGVFRVLWSDRLSIPLFIEGSTLDGARSERVTVQLLPRVDHAQAPWTKLEGFAHKEYADFGD